MLFTLKYQDIGRMRNMKQYMTRLMKRRIKTHMKRETEKHPETLSAPNNNPCARQCDTLSSCSRENPYRKITLQNAPWSLPRSKAGLHRSRRRNGGKYNLKASPQAPMVKLKILVTANARRSMSFPQGHQSNADYMADMIKHAHTPLRFEVILESLLDLLDSHVGLRRRHWTERSWQDNFHLKMLKRWKSVAVLIDEIRRTYILGSCLCPCLPRCSQSSRWQCNSWVAVPRSLLVFQQKACSALMNV